LVWKRRKRLALFPSYDDVDDDSGNDGRGDSFFSTGVRRRYDDGVALYSYMAFCVSRPFFTLTVRSGGIAMTTALTRANSRIMM